MKLPPFEYKSPTTLDEVLALLAEFGDEAKVLAGGQSLLPLMAMRLARPAIVIDINDVSELAGITLNGSVRIGAMTRHRAAERSETIRQELPIMVAALGNVGHDAIRTRGTIGGSVAHADPAAEMPTVVRTLDGLMIVASLRGTRTIEAESFFEAFLQTNLEPDELLVAIELPRPSGRSGWSFNEFSRRSGDFALVGCAITVELAEDDSISEARIGLSGVAGEPFRAIAAEAILRECAGDDQSVDAAVQAAMDEVSPTADLHGTVAYRRHLVGGLVRRGLDEALARAKGN
jgi:carbon-monoxide dehydrogenase medium subunit